MEVRAYRASDYSTLRAWWVAHGWGGTAVPADCISPSTLMVETEGGIPAACVMIYKFEGVPLARIGFAVNNPGLNPKERLAAMASAAQATVRWLKENGIITAFAFYDHASLRRAFERVGFRTTRAAVPEMMWSPNIDEALGALKGDGE